MADNVTDLEQLYTPAASPFEEAISSGVQSTFNTGRFSPEVQAMTQSLSGTNEDANLPTMPIGAGGQMYGGPMFSQSDIGNVAGVLKPEDKKMFIPDAPEEEPEMTKKEKRQQRKEERRSRGNIV
jgi:hypothetical protein